MAGQIRHLQERNGRYYARLTVPVALRKAIGKREMSAALGADYRQALKKLPGAVAHMQQVIVQAEAKPKTTDVKARYPISPHEIGQARYKQMMSFDDELRHDWRWTNRQLDESSAKALRDGMAGKLTNEEYECLIGARIARFRRSGNIDAPTGTDLWRKIAQAICAAEYEAESRIAERNEGIFHGTPDHPMIKQAAAEIEKPQPVDLKALWADYVKARKRAGFMRDDGRRQDPIIVNLRKYLKHNDASRITKKDIIGWRDHLHKQISPKTINDIYLSCVRSLLGWAVDNERLEFNPAQGVKQPKAKKVYSRERGYTYDEAVAVLKAARTYVRPRDNRGYVRETEKAASVKRWVPILCAFTGARVAEIVQLRKEDIREVDGRTVIRITPDAGTVKSGGYRDVPLHPQIIEEGFAEFVDALPEGPLFHTAKNPEEFGKAAVIVSNKLTTWLRNSGLRPEGLQPNHAWRHRFKTLCRELEISDRVSDAIQGHVGRTASDNYGDVTLKAKAAAIDKLPRYELS